MLRLCGESSRSYTPQGGTVLSPGRSVQLAVRVANRLIKFLTVMTIVAWRLFMITFIARTDPNLSCKGFLTDIGYRMESVISENAQKQTTSKEVS